MCFSQVHQEFKEQLHLALIKEWGHADIHAPFLKMNLPENLLFFLSTS